MNYNELTLRKNIATNNNNNNFKIASNYLKKIIIKEIEIKVNYDLWNT